MQYTNKGTLLIMHKQVNKSGVPAFYTATPGALSASGWRLDVCDLYRRPGIRRSHLVRQLTVQASRHISVRPASCVF